VPGDRLTLLIGHGKIAGSEGFGYYAIVNCVLRETGSPIAVLFQVAIDLTERCGQIETIAKAKIERQTRLANNCGFVLDISSGPLTSKARTREEEALGK
jgi:hypothetical protein